MKRYRQNRKFKQKKSIFQSIFFWLILLILFFVSAGFYAAFFWQYFQVKEIKISGNQKVQQDQLKNEVANQIKKNVFFLPTQPIFLAFFTDIERKLLLKYPQIEKANFKVILPDKVSIDIIERKPAFILCSLDAEKCYIAEREGIVFEEKGDLVDSILVKKDFKGVFPTLGARGLDKDAIDNIFKIQDFIEGKIKRQIREFVINSDKISVVDSGGWQIYFNPAKDLSEQLSNLQLTLEQTVPAQKTANLDYIDLRFGSKVYVKYK